MKQHIFSKNGLLLAVMSVFLSFFACQQEQVIDTSLPDTGAVFKKAARQYYDNSLGNLRKANIDKSKTDAQFTALDLVADWDAAISLNKNGRLFLEVPVKFAGNSIIATSSSSTATKFDARYDVKIPVRLIISQSDGTFAANMMLLQSEFPFVNGVVPNFNLFKGIDNFTGREFLFNLNGSFNKGWIHEKGKIVSGFILGKNDLRQQQLGIRTCFYTVLIDLNTGDIVAVLGSFCTGTPVVFDGSSTSDIPFGSSGGGGDVTPPLPIISVTNMCVQSVLDGFSDEKTNKFNLLTGSNDFFANQNCHGFTATFRNLQTTGPSRQDIPIFQIDVYCPQNRTFNYQQISSRVAQAYNTANANSTANDADAFMNDWASEFNRNIAGSLINGLYRMEGQSVGQVTTRVDNYTGTTLRNIGPGCQ
jgi:hypothetical protein